MERAGFSNPYDETCAQPSCQAAISQHGGQQISPACHRHRFDGLIVFYMSFGKRMKHYYLSLVCVKHSCLFKLLLINMPLVRCCSNISKADLRGKKTTWKMLVISSQCGWILELQIFFFPYGQILVIQKP